MKIINSIKQTGNFGAIIAAMGCASCFPAIASIGSAFGLGFLAQFEGVFINTLLPVFAILAMTSYLYSGIRCRQWLRMILSMTGPAMILATLYLFWTDNWSTYLFYFALLLMLAVSAWDIFRPSHKVCNTIP